MYSVQLILLKVPAIRAGDLQCPPRCQLIPTGKRAVKEMTTGEKNEAKGIGFP
jgi:hypothetical protein